ncbi:hypothetical protein D3C78_943360 [compost metagenome]
MAGLDDVGVLQLRRHQLVVVVRDVQLFLADQLPVIAVRSAVVHVGVVGNAHAVRGGARAVVGDLRGAAHAALAGVVGPGQARFLDLVDGLVDQGHVTGQAGRGDNRLGGVEEEVGALVRRHIRHLIREGGAHFHFDNGEGAVGLWSGLGNDLPVVGAFVASLVVPHHFDAGLRNREGVVMGLVEVLQAVAVVDRLGGHGTFLRCVVDLLRGRRATAGRINRNLVGVRIALEQRQLTGGQLVLVLIDIGLGDGEQRLVAGERIAEEAVGVHRCGAWLEAAGPGRDAAVGVTGLLAAQRGQAGAELGRFVGADGRHDAGGQKRQCNNARFQNCCCFHGAALRYS